MDEEELGPLFTRSCTIPRIVNTNQLAERFINLGKFIVDS